MRNHHVQSVVASTLVFIISSTNLASALDFGTAFDNIGTVGNVGSVTSAWVTSIDGPVTDDVTVDMFTKVTKDIVVDGGSLTLGTNADIGNNKIILKNAKSLNLGVNVKVSSIEGTVENLTLMTNAEVENLSVTVTGNTQLGVNSGVKKINLKTEALEVSTNTDLQEGIIYVYKNFKWGVNSGFKGKLTVYGDTSLSVNSEVKGRYCSLGQVDLGVNANLTTYNNAGLFGNIDPILMVTIDDNLKDFTTAKETSDAFDGKFASAMKQISSYNSQIAGLNGKLGSAKSEDRAGIISELSAIKTSKEALKAEFIATIETTFQSLKPLIDANTHNATLFANIQKMYVNAINLEDAGQVYTICNNSEVSGDVNAVYEKGGKIRFKNKTFSRAQIIKWQQMTSIISSINHMSDERVALINSKVDKLMETIAIKTRSVQNEKNLNTLMDIKELLRNGLLY